MDDDDIGPIRAEPIEGPAEFVRAAEMQRAYWTHDPEEQARLQARIGELGWRERLRLHHLICLQRIGPQAGRATADETCRLVTRMLLAADSPYRPRMALIWQTKATAPTGAREPDMQGTFLNPTLTHLGCLEVYRLDAQHQPIAIDFVGFDELSGIGFGPPNLIRIAKLFRDDGSSEIVFVPLLYGLSWSIGDELDRAGRMTSFVAHLNGAEASAMGATGIGVGQQDLTVRSPDGGARLFGLASVEEVAFPLDMSDLRFDEKARARGIDPDEVRRRMRRA